jgi:hypothetical protein
VTFDAYGALIDFRLGSRPYDELPSLSGVPGLLAAGRAW